MSKNYQKKLKLNQINIPGIHDSEAYDIFNRFEELYAQTQILDI